MTPPTMPGKNQTADGQRMPGMLGETSNVEYTAASTVIESAEDASYASSNDNENAVLVSGNEVTLTNASVDKTGSSSGATLTIKDISVTTSGNSSTAIRSDRGGGTVNVTEGTYDTTGVGSPAIYSTADITVADATLKATNSEAVVIEGGNSVTLENVSITGSNATLNGQSTQKTNVLIYQSMSGDASEGSSTFTMTGGRLGFSGLQAAFARLVQNTCGQQSTLQKSGNGTLTDVEFLGMMGSDMVNGLPLLQQRRNDPVDG